MLFFYSEVESWENIESKITPMWYISFSAYAYVYAHALAMEKSFRYYHFAVFDLVLFRFFNIIFLFSVLFNSFKTTNTHKRVVVVHKLAS